MKYPNVFGCTAAYWAQTCLHETADVVKFQFPFMVSSATLNTSLSYEGVYI